MYTVFTILIIIACIFLVLIVLVQNSKGGGLANNFQSSNQIMGVRKTADFLEKTTWFLAGIILFLSVVGTATIQRQEPQSMIKEQIENTVDPNAIPNFPVPGLPESSNPDPEN